MTSSRIAFVAFVLVTLAAFNATPADACRQHEAGLPESASVDGALADYLLSIQGMTPKERRAYRASMTEAERERLDAEFRALPKEDQKKLTKAIRLSPKRKAKRAAAQANNPQPQK